jgi:hypothetical protein
MKLALYKGPADGLLNKIGHAAVCLFTRSKYSHIELLIGGVCWTSSNRDGGVRGKVIDLYSGKWDLFEIEGDEAKALAWFAQHEQENYDWAGVLRFAFGFLPNRTNQWFCSEAVAAALGLDNPDQYTPQSLLERFQGA